MQRFTKVVDEFAAVADRIKLVDLVAFLTAYALIRVSHNAIDFGIALIAAGLMLKGTLRRSPWLWFAIVAAWIPRLVLNTFHYEDHVFLVVYWCAAVGLALWGRRQEFVLQKTARLLIGLSFGFAFVWKIISPEFYDSSLFHFKLLFDYRFCEVITEPIGGLATAAVSSNFDAYRELRAIDPVGTTADICIPQRVTWIAAAMTIWTVFIEGLLAAVFLLPSSALTDRSRDPVLILFMVSTYVVVPVMGFASIFTAMGVAQCTGKASRTRLAYLVLALALFGWYSIRWQVL